MLATISILDTSITPMDRVKESIAWEFNYRKLSYTPIWDVIDDVWNEHLHSPLHAAGYFLNPALFYSPDFHLDQEVCHGSDLLSGSACLICIDKVKVALMRLVKLMRSMASLQLSGGRKKPTSIQNCKVLPLKSRVKHVKVLQDTSLAEKVLFTEGMSRCEQQHLEFVHYNLPSTKLQSQSRPRDFAARC